MNLKKDIIELYMNPPKDTIVLCIDEDSPLSIRPYSGNTRAESGYPKRIRAIYTRTEGAVQMVEP